MTQTFPLGPQLVVLEVVQTPFEQQPAAQLVESHWHRPEMQRWPAAQGGDVPQAQAPWKQLSAEVVLQVVHALPPAPQVLALGVRHRLFEQQPLAQLVASQTQVE